LSQIAHLGLLGILSRFLVIRDLLFRVIEGSPCAVRDNAPSSGRRAPQRRVNSIWTLVSKALRHILANDRHSEEEEAPIDRCGNICVGTKRLVK